MELRFYELPPWTEWSQLANAIASLVPRFERRFVVGFHGEKSDQLTSMPLVAHAGGAADVMKPSRSNFYLL
jgi:hypothetical protein